MRVRGEPDAVEGAWLPDRPRRRRPWRHHGRRWHRPHLRRRAAPGAPLRPPFL